MTLDAPSRLRPVRSFVLRTGRMTAGQRRALQTLWSRYGIDFSPQLLNLDQVFARRAPRIMEIGFGNAETLLTLAAQQPQHDFIGVEVHSPGVGSALLGLQSAGLENARLIQHDAVEVLERQIADAALQEILIYFPDPWPKKRHCKRRLVQPSFIALAARKLAPGGVLRLATDWQDYAEQMLRVLTAEPSLRNCVDTATAHSAYLSRPENRPLTRFERRGQRLGHDVWDLAFEKR